MGDIVKCNGQIKLNNPLGKWIYTLAKTSEIKTIFEIGTWWGLGSTYCIKRGLEDRNTVIYKGYSIECDKKKYKQACLNLQPLPENFNLLYGSIIMYNELQTLGEKMKLSSKSQKFFEEDLQKIKKAPFIDNPFKNGVDLCVLDGGEFSGLLEFFKIGYKSKYLILDDTIMLKHHKTRQIILESANWEILEDNTTHRNGYLVAKNRKYT